MQARSAEIAIIGAGPAGAHLASRLAAEGRDVVLFDPKGAWEKPCGGGVPTRAIREFAFLLENSNYPRKLVRRITMISPLDRRVTLTLDEPFAVYSREVLNGLVLDRAVEHGAEFVREAVSDFSSEPSGWTISTDRGNQWRARFLVGADGAASFTRRRLIGIFPKRDLALAFGYNIALGEQFDGAARHKRADSQYETSTDEVVMRFPKDFTGYVWAFPRPSEMNFGVASKLGERTSDELRSLLTNFVRDYYGGEMPEPSRTSFFGAKIPVLDQSSWRNLRTGGDDWALIGDAAGLVDPITGEGIYYAFRSADLLAEAMAGVRGKNRVTGIVQRTDPPGVHGRVANRSRTSSTGYAQVHSLYEASWRQAFGQELERASQMLPRFYRGYFLGQVFTDATIRIARHHKGVRKVLMRLIIGDQSYLTLKRDLLGRALQII